MVVPRHRAIRWAEKQHGIAASAPQAQEQQCMEHGECFGGQCIYAAAPAAPADPAIPQAVRNGVLSDGPTRWHDLKTDPEQWDNVAAGRKTFELRRNDRDFRPGDGLRLRKTANSAWAMTNTGAPLEYTGDVCERIVTHVLRGPIYGLAAGWAILSLSAASAPKEPTEPVPAQPSEAVQRLAAEQFPLPPAKVQAYADTNGLPTDDVKACESCPTCGAPVTVFQPKVGEPIYTHNPAAGVVSDGGKSNG
jgi:hypothetical protein